MQSDFKVLVFDIDGTLAATDNLTEGKRVPYDILKFCPPSAQVFPFEMNPNLGRDFSNFIHAGLRVVIITRAPRPYASTVLQLLGVDFTECIPANGKTRAEKLIDIANAYGVERNQVIYFGNELDDKEAAREAGCFFERPYWIIEDKEFSQSEKDASFYDLLAQEAAELSDYRNEPDYIYYQWEVIEGAQRNTLHLDRSTLQLHKSSSSESFPLQIFNQMSPESGPFKPMINPEIFSRWEYQTQADVREELFTVIRNLFGPKKIKQDPYGRYFEELRNVNVQAFGEYGSWNFGQPLWKLAKDYQGGSNGPNPQLHFLELLALVIASNIESPSVIIPVPSSDISVDKPAQFSERLAYRVANLSGSMCCGWLKKRDEQIYSVDIMHMNPQLRYFLIEDQITSGKNIHECLSTFPESTDSRVQVMSWTYSPGNRWKVV